MNPRPPGLPRRRRGLCCCGRRPISPEDEDRIEHAFRRMDPHDTGYVTWKQFKKVVIILHIGIMQSFDDCLFIGSSLYNGG